MQSEKDKFFQSLIYRNYEGRNVEYKSSFPWQGPPRDRLIKTILAIANAGGGYIIIGYDENEKDDSEKRKGVENNHINNWETTKVNSYVNNYCSPHINLDIIPFIDIEDGNKKYIVLDIPSHGNKPYVCIKDKYIRHKSTKEKGEYKEEILRRAAIYYRTKNNSCEEISDPSYFDELLGACRRTLPQHRIYATIFSEKRRVL